MTAQPYLADPKTVNIRLTSGELIEIAPGKTSCDLPRTTVPRYGFVKLMRQADGSYTPILHTWGQMLRMYHNLPRDIGLQIHYRTLLRLMRGEFIKSIRISPQIILLDMESLYQHIDACKDPEFWTPERVKRFSQAL